MAPTMPQVDGVRHEYAQVNGFRMHYAEAGEGDPVVLQHGWPQHWWAWRGVIPALAERYRVIVPDLRGFGWSEAPPDGYEKQQFADDLIALLDVLGLERVRYAGHDWGGFAGYLAGIGHPERFERLAGLGIPLPWRRSRPHPSLLVFLVYQSVASAPVVGSLAMRQGLPRMMLKAGRGAGEFTDEELRTYQQAFEDGAHANASVQVYRTFLTRELPGALRGGFDDKRLSTTTQLVMGSKDLLTKTVDEPLYREKVADLRVDLVDGAGHWILDEKPAEVSELLLDFFA